MCSCHRTFHLVLTSLPYTYVEYLPAVETHVHSVADEKHRLSCLVVRCLLELSSSLHRLLSLYFCVLLAFFGLFVLFWFCFGLVFGCIYDDLNVVSETTRSVLFLFCVC